jgi:hypothetical protein
MCVHIHEYIHTCIVKCRAREEEKEVVVLNTQLLDRTQEKLDEVARACRLCVQLYLYVHLLVYVCANKDS